MVAASHARCRKCGQARHRFAKFNLCQGCWEQIKPEVRHRWRLIKERRRLRRAVEEYVIHEQRKEARPEVVAVAELTAQEQAQREIEEIKKNGVPPAGTRERAKYLQLSIIAKHGSVKASRANAGQLTDWERLVGWAYTETDAPVLEIYRAFRIDQNRLNRVRRVLGLKARTEMKPWRPKEHILEGEELLTDGGQLYFRNGATGLQRRIYPPQGEVPEELPELPQETVDLVDQMELVEVPEPSENQDVLIETQELPAIQEELPTVVAAAVEPIENGTARGRGNYTHNRRKNLKEAQKQEILRLYQDPDITLEEIRETYNISEGTIYRLIKEANIPTRNRAKAAQEMAAPMHQAEKREFFNVVPKNFDTSLAVQAPPAQVLEHAWFVRYTTTRSAYMGGTSLEEVLKKLREQVGEDVEIIHVQRS